MMSLERAREIRNSSMWGYVVEEIDYRLDALKNQILACPLEDVGNLRIEIDALRSVRQLPEDVITREEE